MRAPEHRYGTNNIILYIALIVLAVIAVGAIVYVVVGGRSIVPGICWNEFAG